MKGLKPEEIKKSRNDIIDSLKGKFGDVEIIDSYIEGNVPKCSNESVWYLGQSICMLADADLLVVAKGWNEANGCRIEYEVAKTYGIPVCLHEPRGPGAGQDCPEQEHYEAGQADSQDEVRRPICQTIRRRAAC